MLIVLYHLIGFDVGKRVIGQVGAILPYFVFRGIITFGGRRAMRLARVIAHDAAMELGFRFPHDVVIAIDAHDGLSPYDDGYSCIGVFRSWPSRNRLPEIVITSYDNTTMGDFVITIRHEVFHLYEYILRRPHDEHDARRFEKIH